MRLHFTELHRVPQIGSGRGADVSPLIRHLILIAAPSGAGKSTYTRQFLSDQLPEAIRARLQIAPEEWQQFEWVHQTKHFRAGQLAQFTGGKKNLLVVLEYDTRKKSIYGDFGNDPILTFLNVADEITILTLKSSRDRIVAQTIYRETGIRTNRINIAKAIWRFGSLARSTMITLFPVRLIDQLKRTQILQRTARTLLARRVLLQKLESYDQPDWLDQNYRQWQAYVARLAGEGLKIRQFEFEPELNDHLGDSYCWRISSPPSAPSRLDSPLKGPADPQHDIADRVRAVA